MAISPISRWGTGAPTAELLVILSRAWGEAVIMAQPRPPHGSGSPMLGFRVREWRIGTGWAIIEAAARAGISAIAWHQIEQGTLIPAPAELARIASVLNTSVAALTADETPASGERSSPRRAFAFAA